MQECDTKTNICCWINESGEKVCQETFGDFEQGQHTETVYNITAIALGVGFIVFLFVLDFSKIFSIHAIIHYVAVSVFGIYAMKSGLFKTKEANGFFESWKAVDIWLHLYGSFTLYLFVLSLWDLSIPLSLLITTSATYVFDCIEYLMETIVVYKDNFDEIDWEWDLPNFSQDLLMNTVGVLAGYFYVLFFVPI